MRSPTLAELPAPPPGKTGWPWTEESQPLPETMPDGSPWPRVSVVTPSYNQGQFLEETIRSVLLQGYPNLEYIIMDGGSTDESVEIIRKYEPWLAYWVSERDNGQTHAINKGWRKATGEYITWLNSDDLLLPSSLATSVQELEAHPDVAFVYGDLLVIDGESRPYSPPDDCAQSKPYSLEELVLRWQNMVAQPGYLMRRNLLDTVGYLDESLHFAMDYDYWVRVGLAGGQAARIPRQLAAFRRHETAKTTTLQARRIADHYKVYEKIFADKTPALARYSAVDSLANLHLSAARIACEDDDAAGTRRYVLRFIKLRGFRALPSAWKLLCLSLFGNAFMRTARRMWVGSYRLVRRFSA